MLGIGPIMWRRIMPKWVDDEIFSLNPPLPRYAAKNRPTGNRSARYYKAIDKLTAASNTPAPRINQGDK